MAVPALLLSLVAFSACLANAYVSAARDVMRHSTGRADVLPAAQFAARLLPWNDAAHLILAQSLTALGRTEAAVAEAEQSVALNPAHGYAWVYLARLRVARSEPDPRIVGTYRMALRRSPNSAPLQWAIAMDGVRSWRSGDDELRHLWRQSMANLLKRDRRRFLTAIIRLGRDPYWCQAHENALPVAQWCALTRYMRKACGADELTPKAAARCHEAGLVSPRP